MELLSWNIQSGLGCDGVRDIYRIVDYIRERQTVDVICLQEVARFIPEYCPADQPDQLALLAGAFPAFTPVWGTGMRWYQEDQPPQEFGNLTLVRSAVLDSRIHCLPLPPGDNVPQVPRIATETVIPTSIGPLRILNCHIAFHNREETRLQIEYICRLQHWSAANRERPPADRTGCYANRFRTARTLLCGDLNLTPDSSEYDMLARSPYADGWCVWRPGQPHPPTCGVHDSKTWPEGPHCRDYFWLSEELCGVINGFDVDRDTSRSDHQPISLSLAITAHTGNQGDSP